MFLKTHRWGYLLVKISARKFVFRIVPYLVVLLGYFEFNCIVCCGNSFHVPLYLVKSTLELKPSNEKGEATANQYSKECVDTKSFVFHRLLACVHHTTILDKCCIGQFKTAFILLVRPQVRKVKPKNLGLLADRGPEQSIK
jgi:hypothetical protein